MDGFSFHFYARRRNNKMDWGRNKLIQTMIDSCFTLSESSEWEKWQTVDEKKTYDNKNEKRNVRRFFYRDKFS